MRSICDLLIFKTPFEKEDIVKDNFRKINEMFEDYIVNSGMELQKTVSENGTFLIKEYKNPDFQISIVFSIKKDFSLNDGFPVGIVNYCLNDLFFQKENIENFLNDNVKFISNVFFDNFFIDYDTKYKVLDINKGKKVDMANLKQFDLNDKTNIKNKNLLDSMMYIYFSLMKNIFDIESNANNIDTLVKSSSYIEFVGTGQLFKNLDDIVKQNLMQNAIKIKKQMDTFINLIS
ncbi:MAG: hypothetical protein PHF46_02420 [Candidatus Gracilibacteria bacterium]|nr:hypothetical protein [Candidatus Gracilibacteria bacterium]MDD3120237.1 hypothetical protein [Candidatus Gracilibacteria bacterium]MDD4530143.1 hypothetical protein [Candidatus Gracilibacteria bacterium]